MTKPASPYKAAVHVTDFDTLVPAPELSLVDAKNNPFRNMMESWNGNESAEIRYVNGSSVAGTSASSPGVPRHIHILRMYVYDDHNMDSQ